MKYQAQQIPFKRGDCFFMSIEYVDVDDTTGAQTPHPLTDIEVKSQVKGSAGLVAELEVIWIDRANGKYELWAPGAGLTDTWPVENLQIDIQYTWPAGTKTMRRSTETFYLLLEEDVTT